MRLLAFILATVLLPWTTAGQTLTEQIEDAVRERQAIAGVAIIGPGESAIITLNDHRQYPMQSVYKFHLALAVLDRVDQGLLSLDQEIHIRRGDLMKETWSPMLEDHPEGDIDIPLRELLRYTVALSDNNGCDVLFRLLGGPAAVHAYIRDLGIADVAIATTEEEMHREWSVQFTNWTRPSSAASLLRMFRNGDILSDESRRFLWETMVKTTTGPNRIRGLLPAGTVVANKTGTSGHNDDGISAATNDIGIVTLPDGREFIIAVFVTESREPHEVNERIIAEVTRTAWDFFMRTAHK